MKSISVLNYISDVFCNSAEGSSFSFTVDNYDYPLNKLISFKYCFFTNCLILEDEKFHVVKIFDNEVTDIKHRYLPYTDYICFDICFYEGKHEL